MLATWLGIYSSILFPVPVVSKTRLLRNLTQDLFYNKNEYPTKFE